MREQLGLFNTQVYETSQPPAWDWLKENGEDDPAFIAPGLEDDSVTPINKRPKVTESWLELYEPGGSARSQNRYYRLYWREKGKLKHKHIKGGNYLNPQVLTRVEQIKTMISNHKSLNEILEVIKAW